jgi:hypothetical protein
VSQGVATRQAADASSRIIFANFIDDEDIAGRGILATERLDASD